MSTQTDGKNIKIGVENNRKAIAFQHHLIDQEINAFQTESLDDDFQTVIFRSRLEINGVLFPFAIFIDTTLFILLRVQILADIKKERQTKIIPSLNKFNIKYKIFKYVIHPQGKIYLDVFYPVQTEDFNPSTLEEIIQTTGAHLQANYQDLMRAIWQK